MAALGAVVMTEPARATDEERWFKYGLQPEDLPPLEPGRNATAKVLRKGSASATLAYFTYWAGFASNFFLQPREQK